MCNNQGLQGILLVLKNITTLIQIIVPILLIVFATISLIKLINNPEEKNGIKKIINQFIAAIIIFLIPVFVNAIMNMIGNNTTISSCWNEVSPKISWTKNYYKDNDDKRNSILQDKNDYEKGEKTTKSSLDSSNAKEIPNDVLKNASHSDLSIVVADSDGNVIAARKPDLLREGGSTVKVFTGYSAVKLLDPKNDKVVCTKYAQNMPYMGTPEVKVGQVVSVSQAATKDLPAS